MKLYPVDRGHKEMFPELSMGTQRMCYYDNALWLLNCEMWSFLFVIQDKKICVALCDVNLSYLKDCNLQTGNPPPLPERPKHGYIKYKSGRLCIIAVVIVNLWGDWWLYTSPHNHQSESSRHVCAHILVLYLCYLFDDLWLIQCWWSVL